MVSFTIFTIPFDPYRFFPHTHMLRYLMTIHLPPPRRKFVPKKLFSLLSVPADAERRDFTAAVASPVEEIFHIGFPGGFFWGKTTVGIFNKRVQHIPDTKNSRFTQLCLMFLLLSLYDIQMPFVKLELKESPIISSVLNCWEITSYLVSMQYGRPPECSFNDAFNEIFSLLSALLVYQSKPFV